MKHLTRVVAAFAAAAIILVAAGCGSDHPPHAERRDAASVSTSSGYDAGIFAKSLGEAAQAGAYVQALQVNAYLDAVHQAEVAAAPRRSGGGGGGGGGCGDRPPLYGSDQLAGPIPSNIIARESNGNYNACNKHSTASGKYQVLDSTWNGYGGYARAVDAPPEVQDAWAAEAYAAAGCRPWGGC